MTPTTVRIIAEHSDDLAAAVDYADGESVVVRWHQRQSAPPWRCATCGRQTEPTCRHARAVVLAMQARDTLADPAAAPQETP